ncbi:MAG: nucleotidyltransferase domain-containing protein [Caldicoprobacterales bacterium]|jgi:predicted nucleotidyltransferase
MDIVLCSAKIEDYFRTVKDISAVYLFGSLVKGKARKNSDIDIAVLFTKGIPLLQRFERKLEIANDLEDLFEKKNRCSRP